jgi:uncharacterized protein YlxW (UPF0749 family)
VEGLEHINWQIIMNIFQMIFMAILIPTIKFFWELKIFIEKEIYINKFMIDNLNQKIDNVEKNLNQKIDIIERNFHKENQELKARIKELEDGE